MPASTKYPEFRIHPVTGFLDTRSTPDEVPPNGYRWLENWRVTQVNRMSRMTGWRRAFNTANNGDLHDQLEGYTREPTQFGYSANTLAGFQKLFAATKSRIYALNDATENWEVISDNRASAVQSAADLENTVIFTNNQDAPVYHVIGQPLIGGQGVAEIPDLKRLKVTKVGLVVSFSGCMFYMNLVRDGVRRTSEVIWSDYNRPLSVYPGPGSLAGRQSLDGTILGALPLGNSLLIYTTLRIWEVVPALQRDGSTILQVFSFAKRYNPDKPGLRCLAYRHTLVSNGDSHFFWGQDGIYKYDFYDTAPVLVDWIHRASASIFQDINSEACDLHVGGFNQDRKEIWWSWAQSGQLVPSMTFVINTQFPFSSFVNHGFHYFVSHKHRPHRSVRDWLKEMCICTIAELNEFGGDDKEGGLCVPETDGTCAVRPANFVSSQSKFDTADPEIESEDYMAAPEADSLVHLLGGLLAENLCATEFKEGECSGSWAFLMFSVQDDCLKEDADVFYREHCTGFTGCGSYLKRGYRSVARSGAHALGRASDDKGIKRFHMEVHPEPASVPAQILLRIGIASNAVDPNSASGRCVILWEEQDVKPVDCLSDTDAITHQAEGTRPNDQMEWPLFLEGRFIYFEFTVLNAGVTPQDTGGAVSISEMGFNGGLHSRPLP